MASCIWMFLHGCPNLDEHSLGVPFSVRTGLSERSSRSQHEHMYSFILQIIRTSVGHTLLELTCLDLIVRHPPWELLIILRHYSMGSRITSFGPVHTNTEDTGLVVVLRDSVLNGSLFFLFMASVRFCGQSMIDQSFLHVALELHFQVLQSCS